MKVHAIINRFADTPEDIGIPKASYVHHWYLHQPGETVDAEIAEPDRWGKGPYPVNVRGLLDRTKSMRAPFGYYRVLSGPVVLEMEVGQRVFDYRGSDYHDDDKSLQHIGFVVGLLEGVDCVYGHGWSDHWSMCGETELVTDLAVYSLIGCPERLAVSAYGTWDHRYAPDLEPKIDRARRLADAIKWKSVCPVLFISPFVAGQGDMSADEWRLLCRAVRAIAEAKGCDLMIWWDGGRDRRPYAEAEPYIGIAREVLL